MFTQKEWHQFFSAAKENEKSCILRAMINSRHDAGFEKMSVEGCSKITESFIKPEDLHDIPGMIHPEEAVTIEALEALFEEENEITESPKPTAIAKDVSDSVKSREEPSSSNFPKNPSKPTTPQSSQELDFDFGQLEDIFSQKSENEEPFERRMGYSSSYEEINPEPPLRVESPKRFVPQKTWETSKTSWMKKNLSQANERAPYREPFLRTNSPNEYEIKEEPKKPKTDFITARKELQVQNLINYGKDCRSSVSGGGRRVGLRKPVAPKNDFQEELPKKKDKTSDDELCDQLSHIDPKIIEMIKNEIMMKVPVIDWKDIIGLTYAKSVIQEAIVMPMLRPDIFTGLRRPPRGILLFGPPGTGKTLIGKCIASRANATFFNISASTLTSKYIGEGEKMVRGLFAVASAQQPSVIFIDEIDSLLCQRSESEHESSRRLKTEFLIHLDGAATNENELVLVVGATNRPQELDEAVRRRFVKRLYIPLPILEARLEMVRSLFSKVANNLSADDMVSISQLTDGFSGADMKSLCQEASMGPIRSIPIEKFHDFSNSDLRPVNFEDFQTAMQCVRASVSPEDIENYLKWDKVYGSGGRTT